MTNQKADKLIDEAMERDLASVDLAGLMRSVSDTMPASEHIALNALLMVGPELFRAAYLYGVRTGMQLARKALEEHLL